MDGLGQSILEEGKLEMILELIREGIMTVKEGAKRLGMDQTELKARME